MLEKETKEVLRKRLFIATIAGWVTYIYILIIKNGISFLSSSYKFGALYRSSVVFLSHYSKAVHGFEHMEIVRF